MSGRERKKGGLDDLEEEGAVEGGSGVRTVLPGPPSAPSASRLPLHAGPG